VTRAKANLLDEPREILDVTLSHPRQQHTYGAVRALITGLRRLHEAANYFDFQRALFGYLLDAEQARSAAARNLKRAKQGKAVPTAPFGSWEVERRRGRNPPGVPRGRGHRHGMRRSEILALRWADVEGNKAHVRRSIHVTRQGLVFEQPKTRRSRRTVVLPEFLRP
jgi:integrase